MLGAVAKLSRILLAFFVMGCSDSSSKKLDLITLDGGPLEQWIGKSESAVLEVWGEPKKSEAFGDAKIVRYVLISPSAIESSFNKPERSWDSGPKSQGIDNDVLGAVTEAMLKSCFVSITFDNELVVTSVELTKLRAAQSCDALVDSKLPPKSNDA